MKALSIAGVSMIMVLLGACGKNEQASTVAPPPAPTSKAAPMPDVGKVDTVLTKAEGTGTTPAAATADAMKQAILQVNGATIDTGSVQVKYGLDVTDGTDAVSLRATEFAEKVAQRSGGAITNFKVLNLVEPAQKGGLYKITIEANIAHFTAPADSKKVKVVVGPIRVDTAAYTVGSDSVPAAKIAEDIRQQVSVALTNTGRFSVLDREIGSDIQQELDMITSGQAPRAETGKLGQAITADVIWVGHITTLAYNRHARKLMTSDRELVSYSGGWAMGQKLVNVATRQTMTADSLSGEAPATEATTMGSGVDSGQVLQGMETAIAQDIVVSILTRTFPVTVVSREGTTVVLSQGGQSVKVGARYAMVSLGAEMKDPQTGEFLGRIEAPCCEVVIDKVTPKLSYGHLENVKTALDNLSPSGLQLGERLNTPPVVEAVATAPASLPSAGAKPEGVKQVAIKAANAEPSAQEPKKTDKW